MIQGTGKHALPPLEEQLREYNHPRLQKFEKSWGAKEAGCSHVRAQEASRAEVSARSVLASRASAAPEGHGRVNVIHHAASARMFS